MPQRPEEIPPVSELLERAAQGDQVAWRQLVDAFSGRLFALLYARCRDPELAEELAQSTFVTVAMKIGDYTEQGRFEPWLFRIGMNRLRDEMRRRKRHAIPIETGLLGNMAPPVKQERIGLDEASRSVLWDAVAKLSESDQRILHLRHHGELSFRQIAEVLGEPLGTVLARQHRALQKLKELMGEDPRE
jgi:RNA polymerase sigma-70 factor (ECF subfamily)